MKYEKSYWDYGWFLLGISASMYGVVTGVTEFIWWGVPVWLLAYKCVMQSRYIQELEEEVDESEGVDYEKSYYIPDAVDHDYLGNRI